MRNLLFLISLIILFVSCKKKVEEINPQLIGKWERLGQTIHYTLDINNNSYATYYEKNNSDDTYRKKFKGIARANDNVIKVKGIYKFEIINPPEKIDTSIEKINISLNGDTIIANWRITLKGPKLYAGDGTYYRE